MGLVLVSAVAPFLSGAARANSTAFPLSGGSLSQDWTNIGLITTNNDWTGVPSINGFNNVASQTAATAVVDPQTVVDPDSGFSTSGTAFTSGATQVLANQVNPNTVTAGAVAEFDTIANPVVAFQGSGTADAPHLVIYLNATGRQNITVAYNLRDIDGSVDNSVQPVALQYRVGNTGNFINLPAGFVSDASTGPSLATQVTAVSAVLPAEANNAPLVQVRIITNNAAGTDEFIGVDDIVVSSTAVGGGTNTAPDAVDDTRTINEDAPATTVPVLANDTDADANTTLTVTSTTQGTKGTVAIPAGGANVTYTPNANATGTDTFTYTISDGAGGVDTATVTITITPIDDAPTFDAIANQTVAEDSGPNTVAITGVGPGGGDDEAAQTVTLTATSSNAAIIANPTITGTGANRTLTFDEVANASGTVTITVTATDTGSGTAPAANTFPRTFTITVTPVNDAPTANPDTFTVAEDSGANTLDVLTNDTDADAGDKLTVTDVTQGTKGTVAVGTGGANVIYTPNADASGTDTFTYTISDGTSTSTATVTITITPANDAPTASPDTFSVTEDSGASTLDVLGNDTDADAGDKLTVTDVTQGTKGVVAAGPNGANVTYTPNPNANGTDTFTYTVSDGAASNMATVTVNITPVNDAPMGVADPYTVNNNSTLSVAAPGVLANDTDAESDALSAALVTGSQPAHGTLTFNANGSFSYDPDDAYIGSDTFSYTASDGTLSSAPVTVTIQVTQGPNSAPTISAIAAQSTIEDTATGPIAFTIGDAQTPADNLAVSATSSNQALVPAANIVLGGSGANRTITLTPVANQSGTSTITISVSDGALTTTRTFVLTVQAQNDAPTISAPATGSTPEDTALVFSSASNNAITLGDVDAPAEGLLDLTLSLSTSAGAPSGTLSLSGTTGLSAPAGGAPANGASSLMLRGTLANLNAALNGLQAQPTTDFNGALRLSVSLNDRGQSGGDPIVASADIALQVLAVNDAPVAQPRNVGTEEDTPLAITLLASDVDNAASELSFTIVTQPAHGTLARSGTATGAGLVYTPARDFVGADSFSFRASDGTSPSNVATVSITVGGSNDAPVAQDDTASTNEDTPASINVLGNDSDAENSTLSVSRVATTSATHGVVSINADGTLRFVPERDFNGAASFTYVVSDGALEDTSVVTVQVLAVNDAPTARDQSIGTGEDASVAIVLGGQDIDSTTLTYTIIDAPRGGSLSGSGANLRYTPADDFSGADSFTYKVSDGTLESGLATVSINVGGQNDAPIARADTMRTEEDTSVLIQALANDSDAERDALSIVRVSTTAATHGTVRINADSTLRYTPDANFNGAATFTYTVSDGTLESTALVSIQVRAVNDSPVALDDRATTPFNQPISIAVLANDTDIDGDTLSISTVDAPANGGRVGISADRKSVIFTPSAGFSGVTSFNYTMMDGLAASSATITVQVLAANTPLPPGVPGTPGTPTTPGAPNVAPTVANDVYAVRGPLQVPAARGVLANDRDGNGDRLTAHLQSVPAHGRLSFSPDGSFLYTPAVGYAGADSFTYVARDGQAESALATVALRVVSAPDVTPPAVFLAGGARRTGKKLLAARGSAGDVYVQRAGGLVVMSGLKSVVLQLQRPDGQYWNGQTYQRAPFSLRTSQSGRSFFVMAAALPSPAQSPDGNYSWTAIATDNAGLQARAGQVFVLDSTPPAVLITGPEAGANNEAQITSLSRIDGQATDATRVEIALRRADGTFWDGSAYVSEPTFQAATLSAGKFSLASGLPSEVDLTPGRYTIIVRASDEAGNVGTSSRIVVVTSIAAG